MQVVLWYADNRLLGKQRKAVEYMENNTFKSVTFGGFDKQDVIRYIEQTARESAQLQEKLQQENDGLRAEVETISAREEALRTELEALTGERDRIRMELERASAAQAALELLKDEMAHLMAETEQLRPDAEAYAQFRERIGAIECEARKRAADLETATQACLRQVTESFRAQYQTLMNTFDATAAHVTGELRKVEVNLMQLPRAMDCPGAQLKELERLLSQENTSENQE